jgi:hypothetical protein
MYLSWSGRSSLTWMVTAQDWSARVPQSVEILPCFPVTLVGATWTWMPNWRLTSRRSEWNVPGSIVK